MTENFMNEIKQLKDRLLMIRYRMVFRVSSGLTRLRIEMISTLQSTSHLE